MREDPVPLSPRSARPALPGAVLVVVGVVVVGVALVVRAGRPSTLVEPGT